MAILEVLPERRGYTIYTDDGRKRTCSTFSELLDYCPSYFLVRTDSDYEIYDENNKRLHRFSCSHGEFVEMLRDRELFVLKHSWYGYVAYDIDFDKVMSCSKRGQWKETNEGKQKRQRQEREERKRREWEEEREREEREEERKREKRKEERERKKLERSIRAELEESIRAEMSETLASKRKSPSESASKMAEGGSATAKEVPVPTPVAVPSALVHMTIAPGTKEEEESEESPEPQGQVLPKVGEAHNPCRTYIYEKPRFLDEMKDAIDDAVRRVLEFVCGLGLRGVVVICIAGGLGYLYISGVVRDDEKKEEAALLQAAEEAMDAESQFQKGLQADDGSREHAEYLIKWYGYAAAKGHAAATYKYGTVVYNRYEDRAKAIPWFRKAAELGFADAQYKLAECYRLGNGVEKDVQEAVKWYMEAAKQGQMDALYRLGECYDKGIGVTADTGEALRWYSAATDQGDGVAMVSAANILMKEGRREEAKQMLRCAEKSEWINDMRTDVLNVENGNSPKHLDLDIVNRRRRDSFGNPW